MIAANPRRAEKDVHTTNAHGAPVEVCECLFSKGGRVYVCGDGQAMASDVHAALVLVCTQQLNVSPAEAEERLRTLAEQGRYCREIWN